jgi:hypothetical protein
MEALVGPLIRVALARSGLPGLKHELKFAVRVLREPVADVTTFPVESGLGITGGLAREEELARPMQ